MKLNLWGCFAAVALTAMPALATPIYSPFLSVDVNGYRTSDGPEGPTQAGFQGFAGEDSLFGNWSSSGTTGISKVFSTSQGNVTAKIVGITLSSRAARDRGAIGGANADMLRDFIFAARPGSPDGDGFGRHFLKLELSGLTPGQTYEVTPFTREPFNGNGDPAGDSSWQAWSDLAALGGIDGPAAWMDANVAPGNLYQPAVGGVNNPIPTLGRAPVSGADDADPYHFSVSFLSTANASGVVTVYGWADPNSYSGTQTVSLLNGFEVGAVPEPTTIVLAGLSLLGCVAVRRRYC